MLLLASAVLAQVGGGFDLSWNTVDGGGATFSSGGDLRVGGTIGQPDAGRHSGGSLVVLGGFWAVTQAFVTATPTPTGTLLATATPTPTPTPTLAIPGGPPGLPGGPPGVPGGPGPGATATPTVTATATATPTATATATPTPTPVDQFQDDTKVDKERELTDEQRRQLERTNTGSEEDERVEGNVLAVFCERRPPEILIGNRDGQVTLRLVRVAATRCASIQPGGYLTSDDAEKHHEQLYDIFDFSVRGR